MKYVELGKTGLKVSRICFGALTIGPCQANMELKAGAEVIKHALDAGINFIDTAEIYGTYPYIKEAVKGRREQVVIASKSYAYTAEGMEKSLKNALLALDTDYIDIFLLHEQETVLTLAGHRPALEYLLKAKSQGLVKAVGISSHSVEAVAAAARMPEIDVIHPLINIKGIGIINGTLEEMLAATQLAFEQGKGIYSMKPLGGGNLIPIAREALNFVFSLKFVHSVALGMQSLAEVDYNVAICEGREPQENVEKQLRNHPRKLHIEDWCQGCGKCVSRCSASALALVNGKAQVDQAKCRLCSYCAMVCPEFCIKVI